MSPLSPPFLSCTHSRRTSQLPSLPAGLSVSWALPAPSHSFPSVFLGFSPLPLSSSFQTFPLAPPSSVGVAEVPPWWRQRSTELFFLLPQHQGREWLGWIVSRGDSWPVSPAGRRQLSRPAEEADPCPNCLGTERWRQGAQQGQSSGGLGRVLPACHSPTRAPAPRFPDLGLQH